MGIEIYVEPRLEDKFLVAARSKARTEIAALALPSASILITLNDTLYSSRTGAFFNAVLQTRPENLGSPTPHSSTRKYRFGSYEYEAPIYGENPGLMTFIDDIVASYTGPLRIERAPNIDQFSGISTQKIDGYDIFDPATNCHTYIIAPQGTQNTEITFLGRGRDRQEGIPTNDKTAFLLAFRSYIGIVSKVLDELYKRVELKLGHHRYEIMLPEFVESRDRDAVDIRAMKALLEVSNSGTTFADVAGLAELKTRLTGITRGVREGRYARAGISPPSGILLYGPPGNGKTLLARATAYESGMQFLNLSIPSIVSSYTGRTQLRLEAVGKVAQGVPSIVYLDEADALCRVRGDDHGERTELLAQFLSMMDGMNGDSSPVLFMGSTNRVEGMDPAFLRPGRFTEHYRVPNPDEASRQAILNLHLERIASLAKGRSGLEIYAPDLVSDDVIQQTNGESSSFIAEIARRAAEEAYVIGDRNGPLTERDLLIAIQWLKSHREAMAECRKAGF